MTAGYLAELLRKSSLQATFALMGLMLWGSSGLAQSGAGSIQGTVTDKVGAVIPGASIHVVNKATSVATDATSNKAGFYQVPALFAGKYTVTVSSPGMSSFQTSIELLVDQSAVINASVSPGTVTQQVDVNTDAAQLTTTDNGTIAYDLDSKRIDQLPQNGRLLLNETIATTPGLEGKGTGNLMVNGLEAESMEFVSDGVPLTNRQFGGVNQTQGQLPDPDAVQEVRIETTNVGAQYATPGVAIITTKSGTNAFHGSFFETMRNNAVGIAKNRNNLANFAAPHLVRNEFGASAGGPIILPHIYNGRDRSFWFFAYERYSNSQKQSQQVYVPTAAWRNGDFSSLLANPATQLYDPATTHNDSNCNGTGRANPYCRAPFVNNQIPLSRLAPTSKILNDITPLPNNPCDPNQASCLGNLITDNPMFTVIPNFSARLDHYFSQNNRAYVRFTGIQQVNNNLRNNPNSPVSLAADGLPAAASGLALNPTTTYAAAAGYTHIFSPSFFSETIFSQQWFAQHNFAGGSPDTNFEKQLGLPNNFGNLGFPQINVPHGGFGGTQFIYGLSQIIWTVDENLTKTFGLHQLQFGGRYRLERFNDLPDQSADTINFNGQGTGLINPSTLPSATKTPTYAATPNTGAADADFFLGNVSSYRVNQLPSYFQAHDMEMDAYIQDTFRVTPKLTLNLGVRWEDHPAPLVYNGVFNSFDYKNGAQVLSAPLSTLIAQGRLNQATVNAQQALGVKYETAQDAGYPSTLLRSYPWNFLPRFGFAYQPYGNGKTVLRGGYGRYLFPTPTRNFLPSPVRNTPFTTAYTQDFTNAVQTPDGIQNAQLRLPQGSGPYTQFSPFLPILGVNSASAINSSVLTGVTPGTTFNFVTPDFAPMFSTEVNLTFEQSFSGNQAIRMSWVHTHGTNFDHYFHPNNAPSSFAYELATGTAPPNNGANGAIATRPYNNVTYGDFTEVEKNGWSNYDALQMNYEKRAQKGFAFQVFYTWAKGFRIGDNSSRDSVTYPYANFLTTTAPGVSYTQAGTTNLVYASQLQTPALPPPPPAGTPLWADYHDLIRFENYQIDTNVPQHHIRFNAVVDLPFGRNKHFLSKSNRFVDELVGGWQVATIGQVISQSFFVNAGNWGSINPIQQYGHGLPITDCQSNPCAPGKLWFNGFITPSAAVMGKISGLPAGYTVGSPTSPAYSSPLNFVDDGKTKGVIATTNNNVNVVTRTGIIRDVGYNPGPAGTNPFSHTVLRGPYNYNADLSLYKVFPIRESMFLRLNFDAFNVFNIQGTNNPNTTTGEIITGGNGQSSSYWTPRQVQVSARFTF